jgi:hypothetical protein
VVIVMPLELGEVYFPADGVSYTDDYYICMEVYNVTADEGFDNGLVIGLMLEDAGVL